MFGKCWDRIQAQGKFVICQYSWLEQDRNGQFAKIMDQMYANIHSHFQDYLIQQQIKDIQQFQTDLNKGVNKKKKKKKSKRKGNKESKQQDKGDQSGLQEQATVLGTKPQQLKLNISLPVQTKKEQSQPTPKAEQHIQQAQQIQSQTTDQTNLKNTQKKGQSTPVNNRSQKQKNEKPRKKAKNKGENKIDSRTLQQNIVIVKVQKSQSCTESTGKVQSSENRKMGQQQVQSSGNGKMQEKDGYKQQQRHTTKTKQYEEYQATDKTSQMSQESQLSGDYLKLKPKSKSLSKHSIVGVSMKKMDRKIQQQNKKQRQLQGIMGSGLENYAKYLMEESQKFQQTRRAAFELIRDFLLHEEIKSKWELILFGSCEVGYALKQSDVDLVLRIQNSHAYSLKDVQNSLKFLPWALDCLYISTANVPIITLKVNLYQAKKLSNRLIRKLDKCQIQQQNIWQYAQDFIVTVDISMCGLKQQYGGIVSSNNLRFLFYQNQPLKKIIFILKDLLRRKQLNKPYRGGINSYVLAMMTYGIIKKKQLELNKSIKVQNQYTIKKRKDYLEGLKANLYIALCQIGNYLKDFVAFETLINPLEDKIQPQSAIHLNIVDPFSKKLVKTSAFKINQIIEQIQSFNLFLDITKDEIKGFQLQNNKKLKFQVYQKIAEYMKDLEPQSSLNRVKSSQELMFLGFQN